MKRILILISLFIILLLIGSRGGNFQLNFDSFKNYLPQKSASESPTTGEKVKVVNEESVITDVVDKVSASVVTVSVVQSKSLSKIFEIDPADPFNIFQPRGSKGQPQKVEQDIGSGFVVSETGLIVTNKHVVADTEAKYKVVTKDDKSYEVAKIYRDPANDLAIIKIDSSAGSGQVFKPVTLGDSTKLKVGQMAIAIGTALGEFRNTVTVGVISGLGRGITAGSPFEGYVERLDNVIQTDAAINPGNSGGPLLNSSGQVVGVNSAISSEGQNIGFALPINIVKDALNQFNKSGGKFERPFLGVKYKMITRDLALLNEVPEGAYVQEVVNGSPAQKGGIEANDIITKIDGKKVTDDSGGLAPVIAGKKVGDKINAEIWRDGKILSKNVLIGSNDGSQ